MAVVPEPAPRAGPPADAATLARAAVAAAPLPALVVDAAAIGLNPAAARWFGLAFDDNGALPAAHPDAEALRRAASGSADQGGAPIALVLAGGACRLVAQRCGAQAESPIVAWLQPAARAASAMAATDAGVEPAGGGNAAASAISGRSGTGVLGATAEREQLLQRLELATRAADIGIWETCQVSGEELLDDTSARLLGLGPGPMRVDAGSFARRVHPDDLDDLLRTFRTLLDSPAATGGPCGFRVIHADGSERHVRCHILIERDDDGSALRTVGTMQDVTDLVHADRAARTAAERIAVATRLGGISVFERDAEDRPVYFDGVLAGRYGVGAGQPLPSIEEGIRRVVPEDRERFVAARAQARTTDEPVRCEYRARAADGSVRDLLSWRRRRTDAGGRFAGEIGVLIDITELRAAERRAREYGAWLSIATGSAGMGVWEVDLESDQIIADERAHKLFGDLLLPSPTSYQRFAELIDADDRARVREAIECTVIDDGRQVDTEFRLRLPGGVRTLSARGEAHRDAAGKALRVMGVVWDVTERRAAETKAREIAERLQLAALGAGIGSWERSVDGERGVWDEQMYRLFGATPADGLPHEVAQRRIVAEDWPAIHRARREALASGEFEVAYRIRRPDGELRCLSGRGRTRYDADGRPLSIVGVTWDVTEARAAEAALRAKETAERASQAKSEFLSRMSHELRTPLNAIVGFTQLLELDRADPLSPTQRERVGLIRSSGWHLLNLINDVLDLARIESGRAAVSMEVVAWKKVLDEAIAMVQPEAAARAIAIVARTAPEVPATLWADPVRLRQVLLNLLSNAVKYNRDRGRVEVEARAEGSAVVLLVRDSGRGMSAGQIARLFQPFNRLGVDQAVPAGTGIGLAISQRLMQQMEGAIEVDSTPGVGSEFRLRLRAARMEAAPAPRPARSTDPQLGVREDVTGTLLYIEDNPANSALVEQFLQFRPQVRLFQAADGATGLVMAAVCQPDLVLIDIRLPDMMGDEVLQQLRRQPETRDIACVAVSANAMPHDIEAALEAGFADYWTKPLDVLHFLRGIDRLLARQPPPATGPQP
jgi:signal transduction histidine kinase/ActR/RegA family two-component response regulator